MVPDYASYPAEHINKSGQFVYLFSENEPKFDSQRKEYSFAYNRSNNYGSSVLGRREGFYAACKPDNKDYKYYDDFCLTRLNNKWGYVDKDNKSVIKPQFDFAHMFYGELASVNVNNKWDTSIEQVNF